MDTQLEQKTNEEIIGATANQEVFAVIKTSKGTIKTKLYHTQTPETVANFIGLSEGTKQWIDPTTREVMVDTPLYTGVIFHRVIDGFMIQGGDPLGMGIGGPGYQFKDEIVPELTFNKPGLLAMANAGPGTNGSQFFITVAETPWLTGMHTIFGEVVEGMDVVNTIVSVEKNANDKPLEDVVIEEITIERV